MSDLILSQNGLFEGMIEAGLRLADLPEAEGGWLEYFSESDTADLRIADPMLRASTALMLENNKRWQAQLCRGRIDESGRMVVNEATRSALIGGFSDYLFPIIRAAFPNNPINDLVSVQPTTRRTATVVFWNWIVGANRGKYMKGTKLFDAMTGKQTNGSHFSDNYIDTETVADAARSQTSSSNDTISGTLEYHDGGGVIPGTVFLTVAYGTASRTIVDDSEGGLSFKGAAVAGATGTINYQTGAFKMATTAFTFDSAVVTATYMYDNEGSQKNAQVDVQITTSTVTTQRRALGINYSMESMQDVMQEFGVSLEPNLVSGAAEQLNFEIARQLISMMWNTASVVATFNTAIPANSNVTKTQHFQDLMIMLNMASNSIWGTTQKGYGNFIVVDQAAATVIESMPNTVFERAPRPSNVQGLHFIGTLNGQFRVYKDLLLSQETGASADGNILMGYKGTQFFEAGLVWAPYQLMYTTDSLTTADFMTQKGMASRYAVKMVNPNMYVRINLSSTLAT